MKRMMTLLVMALVMFTGNAFAADTANITVTASVQGTCAFDTVPADLDFGALDSTAPTPAAAALGSVDFTCSNGTNYTFTSASANGDVLNPAGGGAAIPYTFAFVDPAAGVGTGASVTMDYRADIAAGAYDGFAADVYTDTVTLTVNP